MSQLMTTLGSKRKDELGFILPHEHVFADLRKWNEPGYAKAEAADVVNLMKPEIEKIKVLGATALVECTTGGIGIRADLDRAVSEATDFPIVVPTGYYREPWIPDFVHEQSEDELYEYMAGQFRDGIQDSGVKAGWIKVSAGDDGITETETKVLRAAARAAKDVNAVIGSHTIRGRVVRDQLDIIESVGYTPERFIWIHTHVEEDFDLHTEMAKERGCWIEYDAIGNMDDQLFLDLIRKVLDAGLESRLLLSHDHGLYDAAVPGGGTPKPYTYLQETFLPQVRDMGVGEDVIRLMTHDNPFTAFARD